MKTSIKGVYKYLLDNCKYYTLTSKEKTYYNVICINYACLDDYSNFVYLWSLDRVEACIINGSVKNSDIKQIQEQEKFIYL